MPSIRRAAVVGCALLAVPLALVAPATAATPRPTVTAVSRPLAPFGGGVRITITGTGFTGVRSVRFGAASGRSLTVSDPRKLSVTAPALAPGIVDITVVTSHGTSAAMSADRIRYVGAPVVTSVSPTGGDPAGGETVTVHGKQFYGSPSVVFGTAAGTAVEVVDARTLTVRVPAQSAQTVDVRVHTIAGTSAVAADDQFDYRLPAVTSARIADTTASSVLLRWLPSAGNSTEIKRDGTTIAIVDPQTYEYRDTGLATASDHTYTLVAVANGAQSDPFIVSTATQSSARPAVPVELGIRYSPVRPDIGPCESIPTWQGAIVGSYLDLLATIDNPDAPSTPMRADFELSDVTTGPATVVVSASDPTGQTSMTSTGAGEREVDASIPLSVLTEGHFYEVDAVGDDGTTTTAASAACVFGYDTTAPSITGVTASSSPYRTGQPITFTVTGAEVAPASGEASGLAHFGYSFANGTELDSDGGTHVTGTGDDMNKTATITFTPSQWGQNTLYVHVLDHAGNTSTTYTYDFYVQG